MGKYALASSVSCADSKSCITYYEEYSDLHYRIHNLLTEFSGYNLFLPTWITPVTNYTPHPLMRSNNLCMEQRMTYLSYKEELVLHMRGNKCLLIYMNNMIVKGNFNMLISPWKATNEGYILILEYIDRNTYVLRLESVICNPSNIKDVDYAIIVR